MEKIWNFLLLLRDNIWTQYIALLSSIWLFYSFLKEGKVLDISSLGIEGIIIIFSCSALVVLLDYLYRIFRQDGSHLQTEHKKISDHVRERIGTSYSQVTSDPIFNDNKHFYKTLLRQDLLDHTSGHYFSFRHIKGINKSNKISDGIIYCESTDYKIAFEDTKIEAINVETGESLRVEPLNNIHDKRITHPFKIHFSRGLRNNESFNIAYSIFLPNELKCLDCNEEIMSISLIRIKKGVENLSFNLCLDFKPRAVRIYQKSSLTKRLVLIESQDSEIEEYVPVSSLEKRFTINWNSKPYIVKWGISNPNELNHDK